MLIANKERSKYAEEYLGILQTFVKKQNQANCKKLLELVIKQTSTQKRGTAQSIKDAWGG